MKCGVRIIKPVIWLVLLVTTAVLLLVLEDKCETYDPLAYIEASIPWSKSAHYSEPAPYNVGQHDKIIVVAALEEQDVSWIPDDLPE